ncbi:MAG: putative Zn-dependent protease [Polaribacter sp.]|jgi:predicted Zn-dependent protease
MFLKFGRDDESQSDQLGVEYSTKIGYDAHYMANFFGTLARMRDEAGEVAQIPTFLSTHPDPVGRFNKVYRLADKAEVGLDKGRLKVNRKEYLHMIQMPLFVF